MRSEAIRELIGLAYDAAGDSNFWMTFLTRLGTLLKSQANTLYVHDVSDHRNRVAIALGIDPTYRRDYQAYYATKNIFHVKGAQLFIPGAVFTSEMMCPDRAEVVRSEFFQDFMKPQRLDEGLNGVIFHERDLTGIVGAIRESGARKFGKTEIRTLEILLPHIQRAVQLQRRIFRLEQNQTATMEAMNRWNMGVVVLDNAGQPILLNTSAEKILKERDGMAAARDGLRSMRSDQTAVLRRMIQGAIQTSAGNLAAPGGTLVIGRPSCRRPLQVLVTPVSTRTGALMHTGASAVLFVTDPEAAEPPSEGALCRLYCLTPAEARVASLLVEGKTLTEIAEQLHVSRETPRIHLKHIFDKTSTHRQGELIKVLLRSPAFLQRTA